MRAQRYGIIFKKKKKMKKNCKKFAVCFFFCIFDAFLSLINLGGKTR